MRLSDFVKNHEWREISVQIAGDQIDFVVFDWTKVKAREEDGSSNVWDYFIGFDGEAHDAVEAGRWIPFGAGHMDAGALKSDGGFAETGHKGMLFADVSDSVTPKLVYFNCNEGDEVVHLDTPFSALSGG